MIVILAVLVFAGSFSSTEARRRKPNNYCGTNEISSNSASCPCDPTCDNPYGSCDRYNCQKKNCICANGYYRSSYGTCVTLYQCKPQSTCGYNEVASYGSNCCEGTCDSQTPPSYCSRDCSSYPCICAQGYVRSSTTNTCVLPTQCPSYNNNPTCPTPCQYGYQCQNQNTCYNGQCYNTPQCTSLCPPNEYKLQCVKCANLKTCKTQYSNEYCDDSYCRPEACVCNDGYLRNDQGVCVPSYQCPTYYQPTTPKPYYCPPCYSKYNCPPCQYGRQAQGNQGNDNNGEGDDKKRR